MLRLWCSALHVAVEADNSELVTVLVNELKADLNVKVPTHLTLIATLVCRRLTLGLWLALRSG